MVKKLGVTEQVYLLVGGRGRTATHEQSEAAQGTGAGEIAIEAAAAVAELDKPTLRKATVGNS